MGFMISLDNRRFKRKRKHSPFDETEHHRKPRSQGGKNIEENISIVRRDRHEAWHILFENLTAPKIHTKFLGYWDNFGNRLSSPRNENIRGIATNKELAWILLFKGKTFQEIVHEINTIWLDPAFKIILEYESCTQVPVFILNRINPN